MTDSDAFAPAYAALDAADEAVRQLHADCCQPLRSPRMEELAATLASARRTLDDVDDDPITAGTVIGMLEDAGAQLGRLQVACCAPDRIKLYSSTLDDLGKIQRLITRSFALDH